MTGFARWSSAFVASLDRFDRLMLRAVGAPGDPLSSLGLA
jgi:hypothetical protein